MAKIGFCCNWVSGTGDKAEEGLLNQTSTTIAALSRKTPAQRTQQIIELVTRNLSTGYRLVDLVGKKPEGQRMLRLTSEFLPAFTHELVTPIYGTSELRELMETGFRKIGNRAREAGVRLSFHPGQYCLLNNEDPGILTRAIEELEYHAQMFLMMGYSGWHDHDSAINIHTGGRAGGTEGFLEGFKKVSRDAQNFLTVENDEFSFGLTDLEILAPHVPIVLDIHHEWVHSGGHYIQVDDPRIEYVKESWRGHRPLGHFSTSPEEHLPKHPRDVLPDFQALLLSGVNRRMLRAHSDHCWNDAANEWAISHLSWMDIEVEAKMKNLASEALYQKSLTLLPAHPPSQPD